MCNSRVLLFEEDEDDDIKGDDVDELINCKELFPIDVIKWVWLELNPLQIRICLFMFLVLGEYEYVI